jgi:hypothetical protein
VGVSGNQLLYIEPGELVGIMALQIAFAMVVISRVLEVHRYSNLCACT